MRVAALVLLMASVPLLPAMAQPYEVISQSMGLVKGLVAGKQSTSIVFDPGKSKSWLCTAKYDLYYQNSAPVKYI